jgi:hypothetical protein
LHGQSQRAALEGVLTDVGYADALIARETPDGLELIDGHLRAASTPDAMVPVLVVDLDDAEAELLLATLDPIAALAGRDTEMLNDLIKVVMSESEPVRELLDSLYTTAPSLPPLVQPTQEQIEARQEQLDGQFTDAAGGREFLELTCPNCGQDFAIKKHDFESR